MEIHYELTEKDFLEAFAVHRDRNPTSKLIRVVLFWGLIAFAAVMLYGIVQAGGTTSALPLLLLAILWLAVLEVYPRWFMRRQYTKQPGARGPRTLTLDDSGTHWKWSGGSSDVEWKNYTASVEGKNQILFYTSPAGFEILPKRAMATEQLDELRKLLQQNIQTGK